MGYTKLFNSIITSTIWQENAHTKVVWITMLALADKNGEVTATLPGLARLADVPLDDCRAAVAKFLAPDPYSRSKEAEGRRIEEIDGGWSLLNFRKYRLMASKEEALASQAARTARYRARQSRNTVTVTDSHTMSTPNRDIAEAEADTEAEPSGTVLSTEPGAASAPVPRKRKPRGPRPPSDVEAVWYEEFRRARGGSDPGKLSPHLSIALNRMKSAYGLDQIRAHARALLSDGTLRKFHTPTYLEDHWPEFAGQTGLFAKPSHGLHPDHIARIKRVLAAGEPPETDRDARARWKIANQEVLDHKLTPEMLNGSH